MKYELLSKSVGFLEHVNTSSDEELMKTIQLLEKVYAQLEPESKNWYWTAQAIAYMEDKVNGNVH